jgi:hypothetical protein
MSEKKKEREFLVYVTEDVYDKIEELSSIGFSKREISNYFLSKILEKPIEEIAKEVFEYRLKISKEGKEAKKT